MKISSNLLRSSHGEIARKIAAVERAVLAFQAGMVGTSGQSAADDTNLAIILASRLSKVWKRVGTAIPPRALRPSDPALK